MNLRSQIENYIPYNEQEKVDKDSFLKFIDTLTRDNLFGYFTASAFVVNRDRTKMVVVHYNIFGAWIYPVNSLI